MKALIPLLLMIVMCLLAGKPGLILLAYIFCFFIFGICIFFLFRYLSSKFPKLLELFKRQNKGDK